MTTARRAELIRLLDSERDWLAHHGGFAAPRHTRAAACGNIDRWEKELAEVEAKWLGTSEGCQPLPVESPPMSSGMDDLELDRRAKQIVQNTDQMIDEIRKRSISTPCPYCKAGHVGPVGSVVRCGCGSTFTIESATSDSLLEHEKLQAAQRARTIDPVNPKHYQGDLVMRIIEHFGLDDSFTIGNCIKYLLRHREKGGVEDLLKARWYIDRAIAKAQGKLAKAGEAVK